MRVKLKAFPAVYLNLQCALHNTTVKAVIESGGVGAGADITSMECRSGGPPKPGLQGCQEHWEFYVNAPGPVTVVS